MPLRSILTALAGALLLAAPTTAQTLRAAPVAALVRQVDIPYRQFTLPNGLRVVVHTDRKAPVVAVSVWYDVGSAFEPANKSGFAHLFEHLMFNGSENAPGEFFAPLKAVGATDLNGTTSFDRTNYFETVPRGALDLALYLESDRMGHLTGAITQAVLDEQRGVVQNEKRGNDNQPYGLLQYKLQEGLFPPDHPYGHTTIGSMADLDAASLGDVKGWFRDHYGPNNAVLVLAGDVDFATAERLVTKYFGDLPRGPQSVRPPSAIPTLPAPRSEELHDQVPAVLVTRSWATPGLNAPDAPGLSVAASVLGGLASSRFDTILVKREQLATQVSVYNQALVGAGMFTIYVTVKPGVDPARVNARLDQLLADFLRTGPTADEVQRAVTTNAAGRIAGLESVGGFGGKAVALAEGALYANDPGFYKKRLARLAAQTPASVKAAADRWLSRPALTVSVLPGQRGAYAEAVVPPPAQVVAAPDTPVKGTRPPAPPIGAVADLDFPTVSRTRLSNGIEVIYARRTATPITQASLRFDAGVVTDPVGKEGLEAITTDLLDEGTATLNSVQLAEARERLGAEVYTGSDNDSATVSLRVPSLNLAPALSLWADIATASALPASEFARVKTQQLTYIAQVLSSPYGLAQRAYAPLVYGAGSGYAKPGYGTATSVGALTRADVVAFRDAWFRPDKAKLFVVSDRPLAELTPLLERALGSWRATGPAGVKTLAGAPPASPRIVLVDRPGSPQSVVTAAIPTRLAGTDDLLPLTVANDPLGGDFLSRLNLDLREDKHWAYGASGAFERNVGAAPYVASAAVQANRTGPSLAAMRSDIAAFLGDRPMTDAEFAQATQSAIRTQAGNFETARAVLDAMMRNDAFRRPDDFYTRLPARVNGFTRSQLQTAMAGAIDPARAIWVVVGDAKQVRPQLDSLGLPVEVVTPAALAAVR